MVDPETEFPESEATPEELAEYRRIRPILLKMIAEWDTLRGQQGCPAMRHILTTPPK
jgi:hypothetical protein